MSIPYHIGKWDMTSEEPVINHLAATGTPFVWSDALPEGKIARDDDGLWIVGRGTDLAILLFHVNLSKSDRKFLHAIRIGV